MKMSDFRKVEITAQGPTILISHSAQPLILNNMTTQPQPADKQPRPETKPEPILCTHCLRTATNGIKCQGICVADSNY
jgi:hypothetical protein